MKSNKIMKETIDKDFDQTENYLKTISMTTTYKKSNKYKIILLSCCVFIIGIVTFEYLPKGASTNSDSYFLTSIFAEEKEYDADEKIVFETVAESWDRVSFPEVGELYADDAATIKRGGIDYFEESYRVNLKITGENIEKVVFKVISDNPAIDLYRGSSGELQYMNGDDKYPTLWGHDAYPRATKTIEDLTPEDIQLLLDLGEYTGVKPDDLNEKQLFNLVYHNPNLNTDIDIDSPDNALTNSPIANKENMYWTNWYKLYGTTKDCSKVDGDKVFGHFNWDLVEKGKELTLSQDILNSNYVLYLAGVYTYDNNVNGPLSADDNMYREYLKQLSKDAKIEIDIVYKDGTVKKKKLAYEFKDLGKNEFGHDNYQLQGTLQ